MSGGGLPDERVFYDDYDAWEDPGYMAYQIHAHMRYGEYEYRVILIEGEYPLLLKGTRLASVEEMQTLWSTLEVNHRAVAPRTSEFLERQVRSESERLERDRAERQRKKERGPVNTFGFVYMIGEVPDPFASKRGIKVGYSHNPMKRALVLDNFNYKPEEPAARTPRLFVLHAIPTEYAQRAERLIHKHFAHKRRGSKEWFDLTRDDLRWFKEEGLDYVSERLPS